MLHKNLAQGRWEEFSLAEQLGNVGSEVGRAVSWRGKNEENFRASFMRALELMDLTIRDPRWKHRLKELARTREVMSGIFAGVEEYSIKLEDLDKYFFAFAVAARLKK